MKPAMYTGATAPAWPMSVSAEIGAWSNFAIGVVAVTVLDARPVPTSFTARTTMS